MKNDDINTLFKELDFDISEPASGHKDRFQKKLAEQYNQTNKQNQGTRTRSLWTPLFSIAAVLAIAFTIFTGVFNDISIQNKGDLASVSPQLKEAKQFYTQLIEAELRALNAENSPETGAVINDALTQLEKLENEYKNLEKDLRDSGQDKRVIYAMISNFQQRIDLLNEVLEQIDNIKSLKNESNENYI